jgi:hypothetical protein
MSAIRSSRNFADQPPQQRDHRSQVGPQPAHAGVVGVAVGEAGLGRHLAELPRLDIAAQLQLVDGAIERALVHVRGPVAAR